MKTQTLNKLLPGFVAAGFVFLWLYTALQKLISFKSFERSLSQVVHWHLPVAVLAWLVPFFELLACGLLLFPRYRKAGLYASAGLMSCFTVYIGAMLLMGGHLPCSCGGVISSFSWRQHLLFNCVLLVLSLIAIRLLKNNISGSPPATPARAHYV